MVLLHDAPVLNVCWLGLLSSVVPLPLLSELHHQPVGKEERGAVWRLLPEAVPASALTAVVLVAEQASLSPLLKTNPNVLQQRCSTYIVISRVLGKVCVVRNGFCSSSYVISQRRFRLHVFLLHFLTN